MSGLVITHGCLGFRWTNQGRQNSHIKVSFLSSSSILINKPFQRRSNDSTLCEAAQSILINLYTASNLAPFLKDLIAAIYTISGPLTKKKWPPCIEELPSPQSQHQHRLSTHAPHLAPMRLLRLLLTHLVMKTISLGVTILLPLWAWHVVCLVHRTRANCGTTSLSRKIFRARSQGIDSMLTHSIIPMEPTRAPCVTLSMPCSSFH